MPKPNKKPTAPKTPRSLAPYEDLTLQAFVKVVADIKNMGPATVQNLIEYVSEHGTDHEDGLIIDRSVEDALTVILDQMG